MCMWLNGGQRLIRGLRAANSSVVVHAVRFESGPVGGPEYPREIVVDWNYAAARSI